MTRIKTESNVRGTEIRLVDLRRQIASLHDDFLRDFETLLSDAEFVGGKALADFEAEFARYCGTRHAVGVGNGTDALYLIFRALEFQPGDEVIVPAMSFMATAEILSPLGLRVVFADIDPETRTLDARRVVEKITSRTRALLPVHLYGQPADMAGLNDLAQRHNLVLIEDAAQAHGAEFQGQRAGSLGFAAAFSFYPGKNLGAFGDGGAITTNDEAFAQKVRMLSDHGRLSKYEHRMEGVNSRLDTFQARILLTKLRRLDDWNQRRRDLADLYSAMLADIPEIQPPQFAEGRTSAHHLYVIQTPRRDDLLVFLGRHGVTAGIHYPIPLHLQPAMQHLGHREGDFPVAEQLARECLSLPMFPELTDSEVHAVTEAIRLFVLQ